MRWISGHNRLRTARTALAIALLTALTAGCFSSSSDTNESVKGGSLAQGATLQGTTFTVSSKEFTEQLILCQITSIALRSVGATVHEKCGLQGEAGDVAEDKLLGELLGTHGERGALQRDALRKAAALDAAAGV